MNADQLKQLEASLWSAADHLRANSGLKSSEYATPILGLIFLKFADNKYRQYEPEILREYEATRDSRAAREISEIALDKCGFYLPDESRYDRLLHLPEQEDIGAAIKAAMQGVERHVEMLAGTLPAGEYAEIGKKSGVLKRLLQTFADIPPDAQGDLFGQIYEYFLGKFALAEGAGGGEFFTPRSVVRLMVEIIEPHEGRVFDPACGSGGMFVQSARFIEERRRHGGTDKAEGLFVCGQEKTGETVKLAKMNLAVNGLRGDIKQTNSYETDPFGSLGSFDYVLANPPFNVDEVSVDSVLNDKRFTEYGLPRNKGNKGKAGGKSPDSATKSGTESIPNANYLWISLFATSLKERGRAALVMANSASDAQHTEAEIRRRLIESNLIYGMLALPSNMFYTVTLPATLWFFEKGKIDARILFVDARNVFTQIDRAHREFSEDQIHDLAVISYLHRGERHRFLERVGDCIAQGIERVRACRSDFACAHAALRDALPPPTLDGINGMNGTNDGQTPAQAAVMQAVSAIHDSLHTLAAWWKDESGELARLAQAGADLAALPVTPELDAAQIEARNRQGRTLTDGLSAFAANVRADMTRADHALREYEKAVAAHAEAEGRRRPQDRKWRDARTEWERHTQTVKAAGEPFGHAHWLQSRFPDAEYADHIGLCKRATQAEIAAQDYSLNPGRYVGVAIVEDDKTHAEFRADLLALHADLESLNAEAAALAAALSHNVQQMAGAE